MHIKAEAGAALIAMVPAITETVIIPAAVPRHRLFQFMILLRGSLPHRVGEA